MPVKATFNVDFQSFRSEVESAIVAYQRFEGETETVGKMLSHVTNRFTGVKIITEATLMAEAIARIGGVTKLTEAELEKVGNVAQAAADKFRAWGREVPQNIAALTQYANQATTSIAQTSAAVTTLQNSLSSLGTQLAAAFSLRAIASFSTDVLEAARSMRALSYETGIGVEEIQLLQQVSKQYGVTGDQMARTIDMLVKRIAGDDQSAAAAVHSFGLSMADLKTKAPLDLFQDMLRQIGALGDEFEKQHAAAGLFGERMGRIAVRMSQDFDQAFGKVKQLNTVFTEEQNGRLARAADQYDQLKRTLTLMGGGILDHVSTGLTNINDVFDKGAGKLKVWGALLNDFMAKQNVLGPITLGDLTGVKPDAFQKLMESMQPPPASTFTAGMLPADETTLRRVSDMEKLTALLRDDTKELTANQQYYA